METTCHSWPDPLSPARPPSSIFPAYLRGMALGGLTRLVAYPILPCHCPDHYKARPCGKR